MGQAHSGATLSTPRQHPRGCGLTSARGVRQPRSPCSPRGASVLRKDPLVRLGAVISHRCSHSSPLPVQGWVPPQPVSLQDSPPSPKSTGLEPTACGGRCAQVCPPPRAQPTQLAALALESTLAPSLSPECGEKQQEREEKLSFKCCQGLGWAEDTS